MATRPARKVTMRFTSTTDAERCVVDLRCRTLHAGLHDPLNVVVDVPPDFTGTAPEEVALAHGGRTIDTLLIGHDVPSAHHEAARTVIARGICEWDPDEFADFEGEDLADVALEALAEAGYVVVKADVR
jgi:hypothetical protein